MSSVTVTGSGPSVYEVRVVPGYQPKRCDKIAVGKGGCAKKADQGVQAISVVTETTMGSMATIAMIPDYYHVEISPNGTLKVWDEVDLETGYGGRV